VFLQLFLVFKITSQPFTSNYSVQVQTNYHRIELYADAETSTLQPIISKGSKNKKNSCGQ